MYQVSLFQCHILKKLLWPKTLIRPPEKGALCFSFLDGQGEFVIIVVPGR